MIYDTTNPESSPRYGDIKYMPVPSNFIDKCCYISFHRNEMLCLLSSLITSQLLYFTFIGSTSKI